MMVPKEVIIVEGRDDTKRLIETFGPQVKTIETNGSALNQTTQAQIKAAAEQFGIIVFTDPDFQGQRLRTLISQLVPAAKHAYLSQAAADSGRLGKSLGIEHASPQNILQALENIVSPASGHFDQIPLEDLFRLKLIGHPESKRRRDLLAQEFKIGPMNGKQLQKKLGHYHISLSQVEALLKERGYQ